MTPSGRDKNIDTVLSLFDSKMEISEKEIEDSIDKSEANRTVVQMFAIGLIKDVGIGNGAYILSSFGVEVKQHGSWTKYLNDKSEDKLLTTGQIKSSIRTNNTTILILILTLIISGFSAWISWLNYDFLKTNQEPSGKMIDSLNKSIERQNQVLLEINKTLKTDSSEQKVKN